MTGVLSSDSGELTILGKPPGEFRRTERGRLGYLPQLSVLYPSPVVEESQTEGTSALNHPLVDDLESVDLRSWSVPSSPT